MVSARLRISRTARNAVSCAKNAVVMSSEELFKRSGGFGTGLKVLRLPARCPPDGRLPFSKRRGGSCYTRGLDLEEFFRFGTIFCT